MITRSKDTRPRAKRSELKLGDKLVAEGGMPCIAKGAMLEVKRRDDEFYVDCAMSPHWLTDVSTEDHDSLIGFRRAPE